MSDEENAHRPNLSRRRRANTPAGSKKRRDVWVTVEEEAALVARAEREKVTVPNLLVSAALAERTDSPTERRAIGAELRALERRELRRSDREPLARAQIGNQPAGRCIPDACAAVRDSGDDERAAGVEGDV